MAKKMIDMPLELRQDIGRISYYTGMASSRYIINVLRKQVKKDLIKIKRIQLQLWSEETSEL